jgi:hypothetical protein
MRDEGGYWSQRERERQEDQGEETQGRPDVKHRPPFTLSSQLIVGAAIVIVGVALLLDNLGVIGSSREILGLWPAF